MSSQPSTLHQATSNPKLYNELMTNYAVEILNRKCKFRSVLSESIGLYSKKAYPLLVSGSDTFLIYDEQQTSDSINSLSHLWIDMLNGNDSVQKVIVSLENYLIIKYPKSQIEYRYILEYFVGMIINRMARIISIFPYTLGMIVSVPVGSIDTDISEILNSPSVCHVMQQKIEGKTFSSFLEQDTFDAENFYHIIITICICLQKAQDEIGFMHNALYPENVIIGKNNYQHVVHLRNMSYTIT